jgi:hypothetical protein
MHTSNTLSQVHANHSFVVAKVLNVLKLIGRAFTAQAPASSDFGPSLCPLL